MHACMYVCMYAGKHACMHACRQADRQAGRLDGHRRVRKVFSLFFRKSTRAFICKMVRMKTNQQNYIPSMNFDNRKSSFTMIFQT